MKLKNKILMIILFFGTAVLFANISYAGTQKFNELSYKATLNYDGSMDVVETWDIYVSETNTMVKHFNIDKSRYSDITNVKVKDLETGEEFIQIQEEMFNVTENCFYALPISTDKFEIAWGVGMDYESSNQIYQISYKVEDAITVYNDCSELYWMFIGTENGIPAKNVTGEIKLPKNVTDIEKLRVWTHGPLHGEINKTSTDTVQFSITNLKPETMLETRIVVEEEMFNSNAKKVAENKLQKILDEEQKWANEANMKRILTQIGIKLGVVVGVFIYILVFKLFYKKIGQYKKKLEEMQDENIKTDVGEFFRDIPREKDSTPAEAAYLYYSKDNVFTANSLKSSIFSGTLLQLCLKGFISFENADQKDVTIKINTEIKDIREKVEGLKTSEKAIYDLLSKIQKCTEGDLTMSAIKKYAKEKYDSFGNSMDKLISAAKNSHINGGNYNVSKEKEYEKYSDSSTNYAAFAVLMLSIGVGIVFLPIAIEFMICSSLTKKISKKISVLTEKGQIERQQWQGLKKYMEEFSMLDKRELPELVLWEKYLVYATVFGISDKVIQQLKVVYPEMADINNNNYTYMHMMTNSYFGNDFFNDINKGINNAYSAYENTYNIAHSSRSSGSGGGGGFSGGGGGRRWRRPEWAEDKISTKWRKCYENWNRYWWKSYRNRLDTVTRDCIKQREKF